MKKQSNKILPNWIEKQASLGPNVCVDGTMTEDNAFWYLLTMCCPQIFESYAIVLHPYGINWKVKDLISSGLIIDDDQTDDDDFKRVSWKEFFKLYNKNFELDSANRISNELSEEIRNNGWPVYLWNPGEGSCEDEELKFITSQIQKIYSDQIVNYYYCLLKVKNMEAEIIGKCKLSQIEELKTHEDKFYNPTAIFPDTKEWCIVSDFDLPFTFIGGSDELIESLTKDNEYEIFKLTPRFKEKTPAHNTRL